MELTSRDWKRSEIATELGLSYSTVKRYQSPDFSPVHGLYDTTKNSKIKPYEEKIRPMFKENCTSKQIEEAIKEDGYV